ncbi:hypothetical protein [Acinetobacter baumannii]|uniref:Uncharacterized protein n=1 Tax=Acinetobacter baumannii TaxID=470 RepID=A0ABD5DCI0_ACIBA|nr:hypothetical protein [Acinetobacter baumannii]EHU2760879.1 hypothetical protein [Acinetobacter baumannii]ENU52647.1 hypothetical protein F982_03795 [Acinetobacter baumannii NIPH 1362]KKZ30525.1 hypothetical protein UN96_12405 [Acinetobacter baumannii]MBV6579107.1 hypothetical protein [Acinetobacter baumannii]MCZ3125869.1 hypothetical protein [Acinetobacter baumannii]
MNTQEFIEQITQELESENENSVFIKWVDEILTKICNIAVYETHKAFEESLNQKDAEIKRLESRQNQLEMALVMVDEHFKLNGLDKLMPRVHDEVKQALSFE